MTFALVIAAWEMKPAAPPWVVIPAIVVALAIAIVVSRAHATLVARSTARALLTLRLLLLLCVVALVLAPTRVSTTVRHTRGVLRVVLDDSASMAHVDVQQSAREVQQWAAALGLPPERVRAMSRVELSRAALAALGPTLGQFDLQTTSITTAARTSAMNNTPLGQALLNATEGAPAGASVLLVSDGRHNAGPPPESAARHLAARGVRVYTLAVGSAQPVRDAAVDSIDAPDSVFLGDDVSIGADIRLDGFSPTESVTVALTRDDQPVDTKTRPATENAPLEFKDPSPPKGDHTYEVAIAPAAGEAEVTNNRHSVRVSVATEKLNVLLVDDEPRWEYRFLHNELSRDHRVALQTVLLSPARIQNVTATGPTPMRATREAWSKFDVVILGDVPPERLPAQQQSLLIDCLKEGRPRGLLLIAGARNMPARYAAGPLAAIAPVELSANPWSPEQLDSHLRRGFQPTVAPGAFTSILSQVAGDEAASRAAWDASPAWYWHAPQTLARPGATVVLEIGEPAAFQPPPASLADPHDFRRRALLATMNYGGGRVLYLASPEAWRLRYVPAAAGTSSDVHGRFWGQAVRWAVAGEPASSGKSTIDLERQNLNADPSRMAAIAKAGGGSAFDGPDVAKLADALPKVDHADVQVSRVGVFDDANLVVTRRVHWALLLSFVALITAEWLLRRRAGLV